jgi:tyrosine aminotransferase
MIVGLQIEKFEDVHSDVDFTEKLVREEGVMVMPVLSKKPFIRLVICLPIPQLETASSRIVDFCTRHVK